MKKTFISFYYNQFSIWSCHHPCQSPPGSTPASTPPGYAGNPFPLFSGARPGGWPPSTGQNSPEGRLRHLQLLPDVAKATPALQSSIAALLESVLKFFPVWDCWVSIALLCQENDVGFNLYRLASDKMFSSENDEISYSSSHMHALLVQKIWEFYLVQEKSYWHKKTGQYFPRIL